ncbi:plasmid mobilization protein MobA [Pseudomonas nunensis]|uniref:plasmid mobilization protein MobA n=1 Tax=Pseudomonas nunensis TaxID=2961896 RepID=UPI0006B51961|nr:plasmid mobilization protein MobA [Pseudomonas nunensis]KOY00963.1 mobilization protein [Pseudomonas nunensis]
MSRSEQRRRTGWLPAIRCFEEEEALVREKAHDSGMSVGQFVLAAALRRQTRSKIDSHVINELRRLGGLQKHLFSQSDGALSRVYANVLVEITDAIKRIGH